MRMLRLTWTAILFAAIATIAPVRSPAQGEANVTIYVVQCPADRNSPPTLEIGTAALTLAAAHFAAAPATVAPIGDGIYKVTLTAPEGNRAFRVSSGHCSQIVESGLIAGHSRELSAATLPKVMRLFSFANGIAGLLPVPAESAFLVSQNGSRRYVEVQDGAYYLQRVPPEKYTLLLELHGGFRSAIPLDLTKAAETGLIRNDIGITEFRKHLGEILASGGTEESCYWCLP